MAENRDEKEKKTLSLSLEKLGTKKPLDAPQIRQSFSHGRSKAVAVEVKRKRITDQFLEKNQHTRKASLHMPSPKGLTGTEWETRLKAVHEALKTAPELEAHRQQEKEEHAHLRALRFVELEKQKQEK